MNIPCILSIQSSVVSGRVGNSAAVPIHALFGHETLCVNSVVLAAHPGIMESTKFVTPTEQMACLLAELQEVKSIDDISAIHSGYLGHKEHVNVIQKYVTNHPKSIYVYDPVFGDNDSLYIDSLLACESKKRLLPLATITTPNMFELSYLSNTKVSNIDTAIKASKILQSKGPKWVLSTGVFSMEDEIADVLVGPKTINTFHHKRKKEGVSGAGDTLAAILTSLLVSGENCTEAAKKASNITQSLINLSSSSQNMPPLSTELIC